MFDRVDVLTGAGVYLVQYDGARRMKHGEGPGAII
jgi:hypothetical protein